MHGNIVNMIEMSMKINTRKNMYFFVNNFENVCEKKQEDENI